MHQFTNVNSKQKGAALVVGLVMLLVMTMLGISSMGTMTTELKIATNIQTHQTAFQVASSALESVMHDAVIEWNDIAGGNIGSPIATQPATFVTPDGHTAQIVINYAGCRKVVTGSSLTSGSMAALAHEVIVQGQAFDANGNVIGTSGQVLGIQTVMVAGC